METPAGVVVHQLEEEVRRDKEDDEEEEKEDEEEEEEDEEEEEEDEEEKELIVDMKLLRDCFTPGTEGEVPLASYLNAYHEMNKFIKLLGPLFHFVAYDVKRKVALLRKEMAGENGQYYVDVRTMINFEKESGILQRSSPLPGTNAFLQLHRALEFVRGFMKELLKEEEEPVLGRVSSELYLSTVGRFHPSILAVTFSGVLLLLPDRAIIRSRVAKGQEEVEEKLKRLMPEAIKSVTETYEACQTLYRDHNLLDM